MPKDILKSCVTAYKNTRYVRVKYETLSVSAPYSVKNVFKIELLWLWYATGIIRRIPKYYQNTGLFEMIVGILTTATSFSRSNPMWFLSMGLRQGSGLCSSSSRKYPGTEGTNQNRHWNHHRWHATDSLERTRLSYCGCRIAKGTHIEHLKGMKQKLGVLFY